MTEHRTLAGEGRTKLARSVASTSCMACVAVGALFLRACGTGSSSAGASAMTGRSVVTITWPPASRLIPLAANSIRASFYCGTALLQSQLLPRLATGGTTTATFPELPLGTLAFTATAFPNADGTGTPQATGSAPVTIQAGEITAVSVSMVSTTDHLELSPAGLSLSVGARASLTVTSKDAGGNIVLLSPAALRWSSNNASVQAGASGKVTAVSTPGAIITVTDTESQKTATATVTVLSGTIVFMRNIGANWQLYAMNSDGSNARPVTSAAESATEPAISPDGSRVVFQLIDVPYSIDQQNYHLTNSHSRLYVINVDGSGQTQLTSGASCYHPAWAPDNNQIVFQAERNGPEEIYRMNDDGSGITLLTPTDTNNGTPEWSPDGAAIAYEHLPGGFAQTWLMAPDGDNKRQVTGGTLAEWGPAWSADGSKIAYITSDASGFHLMVMNSDGSGRMQIAGRLLNQCKPCWSPDGTRVLYTSDGVIYSVRSDGMGDIAVTDGSHSDAWPTTVRG